MKLLIFFFLLLTGTVQSQIVNVLKITQLTSLKEGEFVISAVSENGKTILASDPGYKGLFSIDIDLRKIRKISDLPGAGYQPCFSSDGLKIYFRTNEFINLKRYSSLSEFDVTTGKTELLEKNSREITSPVFSGNRLVYSVDGIKKEKSFGTDNRKSFTDDVYLLLENLVPVLYINGIEKRITPNGEGNYIWVSLSPDKTKILYNFGGRGTFVCTLVGKIIADLGRVNAPQWLNNGMVIGMNDTDDGYRVLSSDIVCYSLSTKQLTNLTSTKENIEMYPMPFTSGNSVVYQTLKGELFIMYLSYN